MPFGAMASSEAYPAFLVCIFLYVDGWLKPDDLLGLIHNEDVADRVAFAWQRRGYWTAVLEIGLHVAFQAPTDVIVDPSPGPLPCGAMAPIGVGDSYPTPTLLGIRALQLSPPLLLFVSWNSFEFSLLFMLPLLLDVEGDDLC